MQFIKINEGFEILNAKYVFKVILMKKNSVWLKADVSITILTNWAITQNPSDQRGNNLLETLSFTIFYFP